MKKIFKISIVSIVSIVSIAFTSCEDFLTIKPTDRIVEEDFWEDKADLQNVVAAAYQKLTGMMTNYIQWGECRSDNLIITNGKTWENMKDIMNANLLPTQSEFQWTTLYNEINYCNKILAHGPEVIERDLSFSENDWEPIRAEAITLRALMHFYLVRVWGEVPYVTTDYNNDSQDFLIAQSSQEQVLTNIIDDLESVKDKAMEDYGEEVWNKGRVTKKTVRALLADVYLWRANKNYSADSVAVYGEEWKTDLENCVKCCEEVITMLKNDRVKSLNKTGKVLGGVTADDLTMSDMLIQNEKSNNNRYQTTTGAYMNIFGQGNSMESIFEVQVDGTNNTNGVNSSYFWSISNKTAGTLSASDALVNSLLADPNDVDATVVFTRADHRRWENLYYDGADQKEYPVIKYDMTSVNQYNGSGDVLKNNDPTSATDFKCQQTLRTSSTNSANWIFYRISDMMLMKAEALNLLYRDASYDEEKQKEAFNLVREIFYRSNPYLYTTNKKNSDPDSLKFDKFTAVDGKDLGKLILAERQREFMFEGKRWFDLVRYAQRTGSTADMLKLLVRKYGDNQNAIKAKLSTITSLFSPIYKDEMKANKLLHQNAVWKDNESTSKTDDL